MRDNMSELLHPCARRILPERYDESQRFAGFITVYCDQCPARLEQGRGMAPARNKILCVEDDRETAALIAEELVDRGFEVSVAHSGQEGLAAILRDRPDLVLCDISMPVMSGFEVLERLTEIAPQLGYIPFVFLTALTDRDSELKGRQLGANDYVT